MMRSQISWGSRIVIVVDALEGRSRPSSHHLHRSSYTGASLTGIQVHGSLEMRAPAPTAAAFSFPPASSSVGRRTLRYRFMGRYREKTSAFFTRLAHSFGRKQRSATILPSVSPGPPAPRISLSTISRISSFGSFPEPQTSPSRSSRISFLGQLLICSIPFHSFRPPERAYPFHFLPHLSRPATANQLPCKVSYDV